jgi:hypothetical protein
MVKLDFMFGNRKFLIIFYLLLVIWWIAISFRGIQETTENYSFSLVYGMIPFIWSIFGFLNSKRWGGLRSYVGRGLFFLSLGLIFWAMGNLVYAYFNIVLKIPVPYPSIADVGFFFLYPFSALGVYFLSKATGMSFALRRKVGKLLLLLVPIFLIFFSYYLLFVVARGGEIVFDGGLLKLILDIAYPIGDVVVITLAAMVYMLSLKYLGGMFRKAIVVILVGFFFAYITDFSFSYTTTTETFFVSNWVDLLYATTFFILAFGLSLLDPRSIKDVANS